MSNLFQDVCPEPFEDRMIPYFFKIDQLVFLCDPNLRFEKLVSVLFFQFADIELLELFRVIKNE